MVAAHLEDVAFVACNTFRLANERTTFADAFRTADRILHLGVRGVNDFMPVPGPVNLDFADVRTVMGAMGEAGASAAPSTPPRPRSAIRCWMTCR